MAVFEEQLRVDIEHRYFTDLVGAGLKLVPDQATAKVLGHPGIVFRSHEAHLVIGTDRKDEGLGHSLPLRFLAVGTDPNWPLLTDLDFLPSYMPPTLDGEVRAVREDERRRLHPEETLRLQDFAHDDSEATADSSKSDVLAYFALTLPLNTDAEASEHYVLRFAARSMIWRFNITGKFAGQRAEHGLANGISVIDVDEKQIFSRDEEVALADGRRVLRFRSSGNLALAERPRHHFQLVAGPEGDRDILIDRLPLAGVGRLAEGGAISEIYVHT